MAKANLKWKPFRPAPETASAVRPAPTDSEAQASVITGVSLTSLEPAASEAAGSEIGGDGKALQASPIATSDGILRFRRVAPRGSRGKLRGDILRVSTEDVDPFAEMPEPEEASRLPEPDGDSSNKKPARGSSPDRRVPRPIPPAEDPFLNDNYGDTLPPPENAPVQPSQELPFASADAAPAVSCAQDKRECEAALIKLRNTTLDKLDIDIEVTGQEGSTFPCECPLTGEFDGRNWACTNFTWKASLAVHKPLYFEEVALERYGHALNPLIGPVWSGVHFFITIPTLPYQMSLAPINECQYVLGYYRPGNCAPYLLPPVPLSFEAAFIEATSVVGGFWILR